MFLAVMLPGCASAESDSHAGDEAEIVGGRKVASTEAYAKMTVAIVDEDPEVGQFCTGIVVDRDLVVSAAHCFDDDSRIPYVRVGASRIRVQSIAVHGRYSVSRRTRYDATIESVTSAEEIVPPRTPLNDIALVWLESPLPTTMVPVTFASADAALEGERVVSAGFGCTSTACTRTSDDLRKVTMHIVKTDSPSNLLVLKSGGRRGTCFGDSGGPDFIDTPDGVEVLAMVSTGPESCELGISVDTLMAPYVAWVGKTAKAMREGRTSSTFTQYDY